MSSLEDDLAYLRQLTLAEPNATRRTGAVMIAVAVVFGLSALRAWAHASGMLTSLTPWVGLPPFDAIAIFVVSVALISRRYPERPDNAASRALSAALNSMGIAVTIVFAALVVIVRTTDEESIITAFPAILFAMYGSAWWVVHAVTRERWTLGVLGASFAFAMACAALAGRPDGWLTLALGLALVVGLPGALLLKSSRAGR